MHLMLKASNHIHTIHDMTRHMIHDMIPMIQLLWPPIHEVMSSSLESSHFVHIMPKARSLNSLPNFSPPRHPLMSTNWTYIFTTNYASYVLMHT